MSADLATIFASLQRHHIATPACPLPPDCIGITWIWAQGGIYKRGIDATLDALILVQPTRPTPGLASLEPHVRFRTHAGRIPGQLLDAILDHARRAADDGPIGKPIEQQYFITYRAERPRPFRVAVPPQDAAPMRVQYEMPAQGQLLVDLHSHHQMPAYFSGTDDRDDTGLSVSAVIGDIFARPEICLRVNVYGHRQALPVLEIFDRLGGGMRDRFGLARPARQRRDHAIAEH